MSDFYCNQKFWWLTVNFENLHTHSCCAATPQKIDLSWLKKHPGKIFNSPELINDRKMMLENKPAPSCSASCWIPESKGLQTRRTMHNGQVKTHTDLESDPDVINITLGTDCNLTCAYCCKFYSSAWTKDIITKTYPVEVSDDTFTVNNVDLILTKVSQKDFYNSSARQMLINEIQTLYKSSKLKEVTISGGEPFLYLELSKLVNDISSVDININTGLGVNENRFAKELEKLPKHVKIFVSVESIGPAYEFIRYGNSWKRFENNLNEIKRQGFSYAFKTTISNITLPSLSEFIDYAGNTPIIHGICTKPDFLSVEVLDDVTKSNLDLSQVPEVIKQSLTKQPTVKQIENFKAYIKEFAQRRSLDFKIFPQSMINWINT